MYRKRSGIFSNLPEVFRNLQSINFRNLQKHFQKFTDIVRTSLMGFAPADKRIDMPGILSGRA